MNVKNIIFLVIAVLFAGGLIGFFLIQRGIVNIKPPQEGKSVPELSFQDYNGLGVKLSGFHGKAMVINSWAAWCPFCRKELVDFAIVQKEFGDKVIIIAVDRAETRDIAKKYTDELGITDDLIFLLDPSDSFYQSISGFSMPETIFINKNGDITTHKRGPMDIKEMRQKINEIL